MNPSRLLLVFVLCVSATTITFISAADPEEVDRAGMPRTVAKPLYTAAAISVFASGAFGAPPAAALTAYRGLAFFSVATCSTTNFNKQKWSNADLAFPDSVLPTVAIGDASNYGHYRGAVVSFCVLFALGLLWLLWRYKKDKAAFAAVRAEWMQGMGKRQRAVEERKKIEDLYEDWKDQIRDERAQRRALARGLEADAEDYEDDEEDEDDDLEDEEAEIAKALPKDLPPIPPLPPPVKPPPTPFSLQLATVLRYVVTPLAGCWATAAGAVFMTADIGDFVLAFLPLIVVICCAIWVGQNIHGAIKMTPPPESGKHAMRLVPSAVVPMDLIAANEEEERKRKQQEAERQRLRQLREQEIWQEEQRKREERRWEKQQRRMQRQQQHDQHGDHYDDEEEQEQHHDGDYYNDEEEEEEFLPPVGGGGGRGHSAAPSSQYESSRHSLRDDDDSDEIANRLSHLRQQQQRKASGLPVQLQPDLLAQRGTPQASGVFGSPHQQQQQFSPRGGGAVGSSSPSAPYHQHQDQQHQQAAVQVDDDGDVELSAAQETALLMMSQRMRWRYIGDFVWDVPMGGFANKAVLAASLPLLEYNDGPWQDVNVKTMQRGPVTNTLKHRLATLHYFVALSLTLVAGFMAGYSQGKGNEQPYCRTGKIVMSVVSLLSIGLQLWIKPLFVPLANYSLLFVEFLMATVALATLTSSLDAHYEEDPTQYFKPPVPVTVHDGAVAYVEWMSLLAAILVPLFAIGANAARYWLLFSGDVVVVSRLEAKFKGAMLQKETEMHNERARFEEEQEEVELQLLQEQAAAEIAAAEEDEEEEEESDADGEFGGQQQQRQRNLPPKSLLDTMGDQIAALFDPNRLTRNRDAVAPQWDDMHDQLDNVLLSTKHIDAQKEKNMNPALAEELKRQRKAKGTGYVRPAELDWEQFEQQLDTSLRGGAKSAEERRKEWKRMEFEKQQREWLEKEEQEKAAVAEWQEEQKARADEVQRESEEVMEMRRQLAERRRRLGLDPPARIKNADDDDEDEDDEDDDYRIDPFDTYHRHDDGNDDFQFASPGAFYSRADFGAENEHLLDELLHEEERVERSIERVLMWIDTTRLPKKYRMQFLSQHGAELFGEGGGAGDGAAGDEEAAALAALDAEEQQQQQSSADDNKNKNNNKSKADTSLVLVAPAVPEDSLLDADSVADSRARSATARRIDKILNEKPPHRPKLTEEEKKKQKQQQKQQQLLHLRHQHGDDIPLPPQSPKRNTIDTWFSSVETETKKDEEEKQRQLIADARKTGGTAPLKRSVMTGGLVLPADDLMDRLVDERGSLRRSKRQESAAAAAAAAGGQEGDDDNNLLGDRSATPPWAVPKRTQLAQQQQRQQQQGAAATAGPPPPISDLERLLSRSGDGKYSSSRGAGAGAAASASASSPAAPAGPPTADLERLLGTPRAGDRRSAATGGGSSRHKTPEKMQRKGNDLELLLTPRSSRKEVQEKQQQQQQQKQQQQQGSLTADSLKKLNRFAEDDTDEHKVQPIQSPNMLSLEQMDRLLGSGQPTPRGGGGGTKNNNRSPHSDSASQLDGLVAAAAKQRQQDNQQQQPPAPQLSSPSSSLLTSPVQAAPPQQRQQPEQQAAPPRPQSKANHLAAARQQRFIQEVLASHNSLRAKHSAPALKWDADCAESAALAAAANSSKNTMYHCYTESQRTGAKQGQNIFYFASSDPRERATAGAAAAAWYSEMTNPGYRFDKESRSALQKGTGHFTALVWRGTTAVGAAVSPCGRFLVCNYSPVGNVMGEFLENVRPTRHGSPK